MLFQGRGSLIEQVWIGLQWSPPDVTSGELPRSDVQAGGTLPDPTLADFFWGGGTLTCDLFHDALDITYSPCEQKQ